MAPGQTLNIQASTVPSSITQGFNFSWAIASGNSVSMNGTSGANNQTCAVAASINLGATEFNVTLHQGDGPEITKTVTINVVAPVITGIQPGGDLTVETGVQFIAITNPAGLPSSYTYRWTKDDLDDSLMSLGSTTGWALPKAPGVVTVTVQLFYNGVEIGAPFSSTYTINP